jgi:hypothetical protein
MTANEEWKLVGSGKAMVGWQDAVGEVLIVDGVFCFSGKERYQEEIV